MAEVSNTPEGAQDFTSKIESQQGNNDYGQVINGKLITRGAVKANVPLAQGLHEANQNYQAAITAANAEVSQQLPKESSPKAENPFDVETRIKSFEDILRSQGAMMIKGDLSKDHLQDTVNWAVAAGVPRERVKIVLDQLGVVNHLRDQSQPLPTPEVKTDEQLPPIPDVLTADDFKKLSGDFMKAMNDLQMTEGRVDPVKLAQNRTKLDVIPKGFSFVLIGGAWNPNTENNRKNYAEGLRVLQGLRS
jgi:hypothetical protein